MKGLKKVLSYLCFTGLLCCALCQLGEVGGGGPVVLEVAAHQVTGSQGRHQAQLPSQHRGAHQSEDIVKNIVKNIMKNVHLTWRGWRRSGRGWLGAAPSPPTSPGRRTGRAGWCRRPQCRPDIRRVLLTSLQGNCLCVLPQKDVPNLKITLMNSSFICQSQKYLLLQP